MAHECPECGQMCYCGGDIDDCCNNIEEDVMNCCERHDDEMPDEREIPDERQQCPHEFVDASSSGGAPDHLVCTKCGYTTDVPGPEVMP